MEPKDRLMMKVEKTDACWIWRGALGERGYGVISYKGKPTTTHRLSYLLFNGEIPEGSVVMHTCDNPSCVRPNHLMLGLRKDNNKQRSDRGRTRTLNGLSLTERFWRNTEQTEGCWNWAGTLLDYKGYGVLTSKGKHIFAHRLSYEINVGSIPPGMVILHSCDNPNCVRPDHLRVGTRAENMADMRAKGRGAVGAATGNAKLTDEQVIEMRRLYVEGQTMTDLAKRYGVDSACICMAINGTNWNHLPGAVTESMYGTDEWKSRISQKKMGLKPTPEHLAALRSANSKPRTEEHRRKLGAAHKGVPSWNKGIPMRPESKLKLSEAKKGRIPWNKGVAATDEAKEKMAAAKRGKTLSLETRQRMSIAQRLRQERMNEE